MDDLELFDLDGEDIDAADDANYISSAEDDYVEEAPPFADDPMPVTDLSDDDPDGTFSDASAEGEEPPSVQEDADAVNIGSMFPIRTSEGLVHQERRKRPRKEVDPEEDDLHPDYALTLTKGVTNRVVKRIFLPRTRAQVLAVLGFILSVALLCFLIFSVIYIVRNERLKISQAREVEMYRTENEALIRDNTELRSLVNQLSVSVNRNLEDRRSEEAAYEASLLPTGYPLSQTMPMESAWLDTDGHLYAEDTPVQGEEVTEDTGEETTDDGTDTEENGEEDAPLTRPDDAMPIALFETGPDVYVIAGGTGVVTRILADPIFGMMMSIDHRNGYTTIYRINGQPLVSVGDNVTRGDRLFSVTRPQETDTQEQGDAPAEEEEETEAAADATFGRLGYQIRLNEGYIRPEEMIEIDG